MQARGRGVSKNAEKDQVTRGDLSRDLWSVRGGFWTGVLGGSQGLAGSIGYSSILKSFLA